MYKEAHEMYMMKKQLLLLVRYDKRKYAVIPLVIHLGILTLCGWAE